MLGEPEENTNIDTKCAAFSEELHFAARTVNILRGTWSQKIPKRCSLRKE